MEEENAECICERCRKEQGVTIVNPYIFELFGVEEEICVCENCEFELILAI